MRILAPMESNDTESTSTLPKLCIIGRNDAGGYTCKWRAGLDWPWFATDTLEACEAEAMKMGFTEASDPAVPGRRGIRVLATGRRIL